MNYNGFECKKNNGIWTKCETCKGYYKLIAIQINKGIPAGASPAI